MQTQGLVWFEKIFSNSNFRFRIAFTINKNDNKMLFL